MEGESTAKFIKLSGEEIPCVVPSGSTVREAAPLLQKFLPRGSLRLITETGKVLSGSDVIPSEGLLQVQVMSIAKGRWSSLYSAAFDGFDEAALRAALRQAWPGDFQRKGPEMGDLEDPELERWQQQIFKVLQEVVWKFAGSWADYWTFGHSACSYGYWYVRPPYPTMAPSIDLMINDVKRWRKILLDLEDDFAHLRTRCGGLELCEHVEMAIASLLRYCPRFRTQVDWHVGFEMWYQPFAMLVNWYLSSAGFEESQQEVLQLVDNAIHGFRSYQCPPDTARQVAKQVASMTKESFQEVDSTADWLKARECLENLTTPADTELPRCEDLHLSFIDSVDLQRGGPGRVQCMRYALAQCRADALAQKDLDLGLLKSWQHYILGRHFREHFREHDAYAKQGRERYPIRANSEQDFISVLCQADTTEPAALRAVRAYLDVCFFHPFDDGNSRLARLVFDFVLTKAGFLVQQPDMVFLFSKSAKDGEGAARLVELVLQLMAKPKEDWNLPLQKWVEEALQVNLVAPVALMQALLPRLRAGGGRVLHLGTSVAFQPQKGTATYGITKAAFHRLYQQLNAEDLAVPVGSLSPGLVDTEGVQDHVAKARRLELPHVAWQSGSLFALVGGFWRCRRNGV